MKRSPLKRKKPMKPKCVCGCPRIVHDIAGCRGRMIAGLRCGCLKYRPKSGLKRAAKPMKRTVGVKKVNAKRGGKRFPKGSDPQYRKFVRTFPCILIGRGEATKDGWHNHQCWGDVVFMHVKNDGNGGGDYGNGLPGCAIGAHEDQHAHGIQTWARKWGFGSVETLLEKAQVYAAAYEKEIGVPAL